MSEVINNGKEEIKQENGKEQQEKTVLKPTEKVIKIKTKKEGKKMEPIKDDTKFESTDKISPNYISSLEEDNAKLRIHLVILQIKFGEITQWIGTLRKWIGDTGLNLQNKGRENEGILNIVDPQFDVNFLKEQVTKGVEEYNANIKIKKGK